jgi:hypothetical protein
MISGETAKDHKIILKYTQAQCQIKRWTTERPNIGVRQMESMQGIPINGTQKIVLKTTHRDLISSGMYRGYSKSPHPL